MTETVVVACAVEGCWNPVLTRGWCRAHYKRAMVYGGDPLDTQVLVLDRGALVGVGDIEAVTEPCS